LYRALILFCALIVLLTDITVNSILPCSSSLPPRLVAREQTRLVTSVDLTHQLADGSNTSHPVQAPTQTMFYTVLMCTRPPSTCSTPSSSANTHPVHDPHYRPQTTLSTNTGHQVKPDDENAIRLSLG